MRPGARTLITDTTFIGSGNSGVIYDLPTDTVYTSLKCRIDGQYTEGATGQTILAGAPYTFLRRAELNLGGGAPLLSADGRFWQFWNPYTRHGVASRASAPSGAANAVTQFFAEWYMDLRRRDLHPPYDRGYYLDAHDLAALNLIFDFGTASDMDGGGGGTFQNLKLSVTSEEWTDVRGEGSREQITKRQFVINATGDMAPGIQLQTRGPAYRAIVLHFTSGNADPNRTTTIGDDTICDQISLLTDGGVRLKDYQAYKSIQQENIATSEWQGAWPAGWVVLDFNTDRTIRDTILTGNRNVLTVVPHINSAPTNAFVTAYFVNDLIVLKQAVAPQRARSVIRR